MEGEEGMERWKERREMERWKERKEWRGGRRGRNGEVEGEEGMERWKERKEWRGGRRGRNGEVEREEGMERWKERRKEWRGGKRGRNGEVEREEGMQRCKCSSGMCSERLFQLSPPVVSPMPPAELREYPAYPYLQFPMSATDKYSTPSLTDGPIPHTNLT